MVGVQSNTSHEELVLGLTLHNRNPLPDLPHSAFPLERLFPGANWTLNQACQSLFPGPSSLGSADTDGLPGKASETLSAHCCCWPLDLVGLKNARLLL